MANEGILTVSNGLAPHPQGNENLRAAIELLSRRVGAHVATTTALAAIPAAERYEKMIMLVGTTTVVAYYFDADAESGDVAPAAGTGYWKLLESDAAALAALALATGAALVGFTDTYSKVTGTTLQAVVDELTTTTGAAMVGIADAGSFITATDVEGALAEIVGTQNDRVGMYHREFDHADTDVAVAATSVDIDFGAALPTNAIVAAVLANVTEAFDDDGPTDTYEADVGVSSGDEDKYTPTALTLDDVADLGTQVVFLDGSATQLAVQFRASGSKLLNTLVSGKLDLTVLFVTPKLTEVAAP